MYIEYSNWDVGNPSLLEGDCLCLSARTVKWRDCDCTQQYRYICIQGDTDKYIIHCTSDIANS